MKKILRVGFILVAVFAVSSALFNARSAKAATDTATLTTTVLQYLSFSLTAGDTVAFGNLTPGTPIPAPATGTVASVTTNAANGYTLGVSDATAAPNSVMVHTDATTHITKMTNGTIATPVAWGSNTGVGINLFAADSTPEAKWCAATCTTYNDTDNLYAAIPETATTAHTVTGSIAGADTSSWDFKVDVPNTQKTGAYEGIVTFTATAVLS